jgi:adenosylmethionine-8-amino-7-oxononanoate aminotransferase
MLPSESPDQYVQRLCEEYESTILREGADTFIAFFLEPVTGATSGCLVPPPGYLQMVRDLCTKYGILMVCDEVMSGMGRCGSFHAHKHPDFGISQSSETGRGRSRREREASMPDIQTVAKGLGGGYVPIAAILISGKVVDVLRQGKFGNGAWVHGLTYQGHSLACATSLAVQRFIQDNAIIASPAFTLFGAMLKARLEQENFEFVGDVRGSGLFWAVEFVQDRRTKVPFKREKGLGMLVHETCLKNGLAVYPSNGTVDGVEGDHVILAPPYNVSHDEMVEIADLLCHSLRGMENEIASLRG